MTEPIRSNVRHRDDARRQMERMEWNRSKQDLSNFDADTAPPETDALDDAFGRAGTIDGFLGILNEAGLDENVYLCAAVNNEWWLITMEKAPGLRGAENEIAIDLWLYAVGI